MEKKKISDNISISYQHSKLSSIHFASIYDRRTGSYIISLMTNNRESLIKQITDYAKLDEQAQTQLRKIIA